MFDVVALGELLIDFTPWGTSQNRNLKYEMNPGGAPANVLAVVSKLGGKTAFIGQVGNDQFGLFLRETLAGMGVNVEGLLLSEEYSTTLAFVHLDKNGDRSFSFYRSNGADIMLQAQDVRFDLIKQSSILHVGSVSMTHEPSRTATLEAVKAAKTNNVLVSFDPNLRPALWASLDEAKKVIEGMLQYADILKLSQEELYFLTGTDEIADASAVIARKYGIELILITMGASGSFYRLRDEIGQLPAYNVETIDTTGAGDAFLGAVLHKILSSGKSLKNISAKDVEAFVDFANAAGSLVTTKRGAIPAIPTLCEINRCMATVNKLA
ncbi:carbohydrate kinase family protein [Clostridium thermosuccinogenes]|uniref:carbohydrate kinase family protein n=1 Tax=Clostridium thermosuccinogenes TaxID=84032 RepID=UPI000CCC5764|nr:carbohydrate kinase [Pseudoclostridium thermosuccinogenes]PNT90631.1 carbohydrate kinase [Pseudoclostridium thermosuccinogenes]